MARCTSMLNTFTGELTYASGAQGIWHTQAQWDPTKGIYWSIDTAEGTIQYANYRNGQADNGDEITSYVLRSFATLTLDDGTTLPLCTYIHYIPDAENPTYIDYDMHDEGGPGIADLMAIDNQTDMSDVNCEMMKVIYAGYPFC